MMLDGFVRSPSVPRGAGLRFFVRHCGVRLCTPHSSRFARLASGAFYCAVYLGDFLRSHHACIPGPDKFAKAIRKFRRSRVSRQVAKYAKDSQLTEVVGRFSENVNLSPTSPISPNSFWMQPDSLAGIKNGRIGFQRYMNLTAILDESNQDRLFLIT